MNKSLPYIIAEEAKRAGAKLSPPRWGDAGYDLYAAQAVTIFKGEQKVVPTGLRLAIPWGYVGMIVDRSSMALKRLYTHGGIIDASYRGEVNIIIENRSEQNYHIEPADRVAQLLILACESTIMPQLSIELPPTARGEGAFGSTGK